MITSLRNIRQVLTLKGVHEKNGRKLKAEDLNILENASIVYDSGKILWVGPDQFFPSEYLKSKQINLEQYVLTPEIVDSHTHLVFGGDRAKEYVMRLNGATYEQIAKSGGGILYTMKTTRTSSEEELYSTAVQRINKMHQLGVGTIEIKSGYGLSFDSELKIIEVINKLKKHFHNKVQIFCTYMAAHAVPIEFKNSNEYIDQVVVPLMDHLHKLKLIDAVDIFHEQNYFTTNDCNKLFASAKILNLPVKMHADEFNDNQGASLAVAHQALSCDHLLCTNDDGFAQLAGSKTVATLLPGTGFFLGKNQAPARKMLDAGVQVAIASDFNPGSCHFPNLVFLSAIAGVQYKMNIAETISAITYNSARALGLNNQGAIINNFKPRFSIFKTNCYENIFYNWGENLAVEPSAILN